MTTRSDAAKINLYLFLLAIQIIGAVAFVYQALPEFRRVVVYPGAQLPPDIAADLMAVCIVVVITGCAMFRFHFGARTRS